MTQALRIARHEIAAVLHTPRAVVLTVLYLGAATLGGLGYVLIVRTIEAQAVQALQAQGQDPASAAANIALVGEQAYGGLVAFFAGTATEDLAGYLLDAAVLPPFLWASLAFLPFLIVLTSFDALAGDLASRAICYTSLRARRRSILAGKLLAQLVLVGGLLLGAAVVLGVLGVSLLSSQSAHATALGLLRLWPLLLAYGACYLGVSAFAQAWAKQPGTALFAALGIMVALRLVGFLRHLPEDSSAGVLRHLQWLSPARYHAGFWQSGFEAPLWSAFAYLAIGLAFALLAVVRLRGRDL